MVISGKVISQPVDLLRVEEYRRKGRGTTLTITEDLGW